MDENTITSLLEKSQTAQKQIEREQRDALESVSVWLTVAPAWMRGECLKAVRKHYEAMIEIEIEFQKSIFKHSREGR